MPLLLATLTLVGLTIALIDEAQPWRGLAWILLFIPLLIAGLVAQGKLTRRSNSRE